MSSDTVVHRRKPLSVSVLNANLALSARWLGVTVALGVSTVYGQDVIDVAPGTTSLQITPENHPAGLTINVADGIVLEDLFILPFADPSSLNNPQAFAINVDGTVSNAVIDAGAPDLTALVPLSSLNISSTGLVSVLSVTGGADITNDGVISFAPATNSGTGFLPALTLSTPFDDATGRNWAYTVVNNGSIIAEGSNLPGGIFGTAVRASGVFGPVPGTVSLNLTNTGTMALGDDATGALIRWNDADDVLITNSGTLDAGFTAVVGGFNFDPVVFLRDNSQATGNEFDDTMVITNESSGEITGARVIIASPSDGSESYNVTFTNAGSITASGADFASPSDPGGAAFVINGQSTFTNSGSILVDGSLLDGGNGSGAFFNQFIEFGATPEPSDFDAQTLTFLNAASGVIDATGKGLQFSSGIATNDGTLIARGEADGYGIRAIAPLLANTSQDLWNDSVDVVNNGLIQAGFFGVAKEVGIVNMNLTNSGTIEIIQDTAFEPSAVSIIEGTMSINNLSTGILRGPTAVSGTGDSLNIVNDGLIDGGIQFSGIATIENSGTIVGDVDVGAGNDTVSGSGTFDGSVFLGEGDDLFIAEGGLSVTGTVFGGNGFDTIRFINAGFGQGASSVFGTFLEFDAVFFEGSFSLGDSVASTVSLTAPELTFEPNAVFTVDALEDGTSDLLANTGPIVLNGGEVQALSNDGAWSVARDFTIITSDTSVTGTFDAATSNQPYLDASLSYTPTSVILSLERIDGLIQGDILETTNAQQLSVAARVVPEIVQTQVSSSILKLLGSSGAASGGGVAGTVGLMTGLSAGDEVDGDAGARGSAWLNLTPTRYDQRAVLPGAVGPQEIDGETVNLLIGADRLLGSRFVAGAFLGYEDSEVEYRAISGFQENDGYLLGAYGGVAFNSWLFSSVNLNWAQLDNELEERAFDSPETQRASYDSERLSIGIDLTAVAQRGSVSYLGRAAYNYSSESYDSYRTARGEVVQLDDLSLGRFSVTGEVSYAGDVWSPYLSLGYEYDANVSNTVSDDTGLVVNAGVRAVRNQRLTFEGYVATVTSRGNENQELIGLNVNYAF